MADGPWPVLRAHSLCGLRFCLCPRLPLDMAVCGQLPPSPVGRELWKRELLGNKSKQPSLPPGPRDWRGCASSCAQTACGVGGGSRGGNHWAELGIARVTGVLAARGQLRSEKEANPSALPLLISQLCNLGCEAARIAL